MCRSLAQADWIRPRLPAKRGRHESVAIEFIYLSIYLSLSTYLSASASRKNVRCAWAPREASTRPRTWCKYSFCYGAGALYGYVVNLAGIRVPYGFRELRVVLRTRILHAAAVCSVRGSLSQLDCSMPIVQVAPKPFMMLMMHYSASITSLASPDLIFTAFLTLALERSTPPISGFTLSKGPPQRPTPPHPLNSLRSP